MQLAASFVAITTDEAVFLFTANYIKYACYDLYYLTLMEAPSPEILEMFPKG